MADLRKRGCDNLDVKQYLGSLRVLDARIDQRIKQLDELKNRRSFISAAEYLRAASREAGVGRNGGAFDMLTDLQAEISDEILQFERQRNDIIGKIQSLNDHKFMQVLYKRYVEYKPFEQIAAELGYARSHTLLLHRNAIAAMEELTVYS